MVPGTIFLVIFFSLCAKVLKKELMVCLAGISQHSRSAFSSNQENKKKNLIPNGTINHFDGNST